MAYIISIEPTIMNIKKIYWKNRTKLHVCPRAWSKKTDTHTTVVCDNMNELGRFVHIHPVSPTCPKSLNMLASYTCRQLAWYTCRWTDVPQTTSKSRPTKESGQNFFFGPRSLHYSLNAASSHSPVEFTGRQFGYQNYLFKVCSFMT